MVETKNNIGNRQPDSNAGCSKQKGVKNKQTRQLVLWIGALIVGAVLGIFGISWLDGLMNFIATVYTRLFQLLAVPTIALAVITTLASLGNQADTGKIFRHAITYTLLTTIAAAAVGLVLYNIVSPGNLPTALVQSGMADVPQKLGETSYYDHILGVIPNNIIKPFAEGNVLSILILAAAAGIALAKMPSSDKKEVVMKGLFGLQDLLFMLIHGLIWALPLGIVAFAAQLSAQFSAGIVMASLGKYVAVILGGNVIQFFIILPLFLLARGLNPVRTLGKMMPAVLIANKEELDPDFRDEYSKSAKQLRKEVDSMIAQTSIYSSNQERLSADIKSAKSVLKELISALKLMVCNHSYCYNKNENEINI